MAVQALPGHGQLAARQRDLAGREAVILDKTIGTLCRELLDRTLILGERHLALVLNEYLTHHNRHRPHQSPRQRPRTSKRHLFGTWPTCDLSAENPSPRGVVSEYHHAV